MEARWSAATCRLKSEVESLRRDVAGTFFNLNGSAGGGGKCCRAEAPYEAAGGAAMYGSHRLLKVALS